MTLSSHAVIGAAAARISSTNPLVGFFVGFASHYLADAVPHWDYELRSARLNRKHPLESDIVVGKDFVFDLSKILLDIALGFFLAFMIFSPSGINPIILFAGACGGIAPDALQFVYYKIRREPLISMQKFHNMLHAKIRLYNPLTGIPFQIFCVVSILYLLSLLG